MDEDDLAPFIERFQGVLAQFQGEFEKGLVHDRSADSERLDNTIHGITDATRNPAVKEWLTNLDREIHRVFDAVEAASADPDTEQTLELVKGGVVLTSVMNAIAEARINVASETPDGESAMELTAARRGYGEVGRHHSWDHRDHSESGIQGGAEQP